MKDDPNQTWQPLSVWEMFPLRRPPPEEQSSPGDIPGGEFDAGNPQGLHYQPPELDPLKHPPHEPFPIEHERGRPKDTGRGGA